MYLLVWSPAASISGWDWMWIILGVVLDAAKWGQIVNNRRGIPGYGHGDASGVQQQAYATPTPASQPVTEVGPASTAPGEAELTRLAELRDQGILTEEEFQAKKKQLQGDV